MSRLSAGLWVAVLAGCGTASPADGGVLSFPLEPLVTVTTALGRAVAVRTAPSQPPSRGVVTVRLEVSDGAGAAVSGLGVEATPWMPDHGHGASVVPTVQEEGGGAYLVRDLYLVMPGRWELRLAFSGGADDSATATLQIP